MAKFSPPELAILLPAAHDRAPKELNRRAGEIVTVVKFANWDVPFSSNYIDWWEIKLLNQRPFTSTFVREPFLKKLPPHYHVIVLDDLNELSY